MTDQTGRFAVTVGFGGIAGLLQGGQHAIIPDLIEQPSTLGIEPSPGEIVLMVNLLSLLSLVITIGIFVAGYWWARRADIPGAYSRFAVSLFGVAIIGLAIGYLVMLFLLADPEGLANQMLLSIDGVSGAIASVIWIPFVGLAGGALAQYRFTPESPWQQWLRDRDSVQFFIAVGLAGVAGFLRSLRLNITPVLVEYHSVFGLELSSYETERLLTVISSALTLFSVAVTISLFLAGYMWARRADMPAAYGYFAVSLFVAAIVGLGVGFLITSFLVPDQPLPRTIILFSTFTIYLISIPIPAIAGGTIAESCSITDASQKHHL